MLALVAFGLALAAPVSDGDRWVAIQRSVGVVEVRDEAKGIKRTPAGREWVAERVDGYHWWNRRYRNRMTGELRGDVGRGEWADLDAPQLARPLCTPVRRRASPGRDDPSNVPPAWDDVGYDGGAAAALTGRLWFCGDAHPRVLRDASSLTIGGGWATWQVGNAVEAERLRDRRRYELPRSGDLVHTRRAIYVRDGTRVFRARLPHA